MCVIQTHYVHEIVVQEEATGALCQTQAVFAQGQLLAFHCTQTRGVSVGGGHAARMGVDHPSVREHLVTLGEVEDISNPQHGHPGIRSHSLMAILLGVADHGGSRRELLRTIVEDIRGRGNFTGSTEDLTPLRMDPPSLIPLGVVSGQLLLNPHAAHHIATGAINAYSLTDTTVETMMSLDG